MTIKNVLKRTFLLLSVATIFAGCFSGKNDKESSVMNELPLKSSVGGDQLPFPESHASTLIRLQDGQFLIAWFGGTEESHDDVGIWMSKGTPGHWTSPHEVAKLREDAHWNPVLFKSPDEKIHLFFKVGKTIPKWETWLQTSIDEGETWSDATELVLGDKGGRGPVRNKPIVLSDGTWLAGASNEEGEWNVFIDRSEDKGKTWTATPYLELNRDAFTGKGIIQPTLWESAPGEVHMLLRSTNDAIYRSDSKDYGKTWSAAYKTSLPNPNSGIDLTRLDDGTLALVYNPTTKKMGKRAKLSLALSHDNGETWPSEMTLENEENDDAEFSYPAVISFGDTIAVTYTWNREKIMFWEGTKQEIIEASEPK